MSWMKQALLATGFVALGAIGATAWRASADEPPPPGAFDDHPRVEALVQDLKLDANQQAALQALIDARKAMRDDFMAAREDRRDEVINLLTAENPDRKAVHREIDERSAERLKAVHNVADKALDLAATLTPEQRTTLSQRLSEGPRGPGMGPGSGECPCAGEGGRGGPGGRGPR